MYCMEIQYRTVDVGAVMSPASGGFSARCRAPSRHRGARSWPMRPTPDARRIREPGAGEPLRRRAGHVRLFDFCTMGREGPRASAGRAGAHRSRRCGGVRRGARPSPPPDYGDAEPWIYRVAEGARVARGSNAALPLSGGTTPALDSPSDLVAKPTATRRCGAPPSRVQGPEADGISCATDATTAWRARRACCCRARSGS